MNGKRKSTRMVGLVVLVLLPMVVTAVEPVTVELRAITVRPEPGESRLPDSTVPAALFDASALEAANVRHFQDLIGLAPGLTWAGGTSRPRYLQMRGIGEVSQFAGEGPPNFSVGFLVDDMDFSGMGMHASLFDTEEVEILRGPQAAIYGSKALAGLINIRTRDPQPYLDLRLSATLGTDALLGFSAAGGGPLMRDPDLLQMRVTVERERQNGFRRNRFLGRDDTNQRDDFSGRLKLRLQPGPDWRFDVTGLAADQGNGYDQFTPGNDRTSTYTDRPGLDTQKSAGGAMRIHWLGLDTFRVLNIFSYVENKGVYSYDADWGNNVFWATSPYFWDAAEEGFDYDFFERLDRQRRTLTQDLRLISEPGGEIFADSSAWHIGGFVSKLCEKDDFDGFRLLQSEYEAISGAIYGQVTTRVRDGLLLYTSLRVEQRATDYRDSDAVALDQDETMWGGRLALEILPCEELTVFTAVSRGFKGGGVNQNPALPQERRGYGAETLLNFEAGVRAAIFDGRLDAELTVFHMLRDDLQITSSFQADPRDPTAFAYYTDNAAKGYNRGVEVSVSRRMTDAFALFGALSLLDTEYREFESAGGINDIDGRDQPFAPHYSYVVGAHFRAGRGLFARAEVEGRAAHYFAAGHNERSGSYDLVHLKTGWEGEHWTFTLWGRNVLDRKYAVQGYYFGLEPPAYADTLYLTYGAPAQVGVTFDVVF